MNADESTRKKTTGVYGADLVPGTYVKTMTGVTRGEELFSRPDLERPWRSTTTQKYAASVALKEKEIEELMRLCSRLRTELGNAKSDARFSEFALTEKTKSLIAEKDCTIVELEKQLEERAKDISEAKENAEHQIRLLKSQHENDLLGARNEARLATERCADLAKAYQKQVDDIRVACTKEVGFVESRFNSRTEELAAEVKAVRSSSSAAEKHYEEQTTANTAMLRRVESEFKEQLRASEARIEDLRKAHEAELDKERTAKEKANAEIRRLTEQLAIALIDKDEVTRRYKLWTSYILAGLDRFYNSFVEVLPELSVEPVDPQLREVPTLYAPRTIMEEPEAKVDVERVAYRVLQLKRMSNTRELREALGAISSADAVGDADSLDAAVSRAADRQERLNAAVRETTDKIGEMDAVVSNVLARLSFFNDNLESVVAQAPRRVEAPIKNVVFVCLSVAGGEALWASNAETMGAAVMLLENTVRLKMGEYGAYECYSDSVSMLLAFSDAAAACRFCVESQEWLLRVPWPAALRRFPSCKNEADNETVLFSGLRVAMAMHAGECFVEPTGIPGNGGSYRTHYYGRAVSQIVHISSLAQGGQVVVTKPAWLLCLRRRRDLGRMVVSDLGAFPIISFNSLTGSQETQSLELYQVTARSLQNRTFKPISKMDVPPVSSVTGVKRYVLSAEMDALEERRDAIKEAMELICGEYKAVQEEVSVVLTRCRNSRSQFHLLPPPEMVTQMNDLYAVMEKVAVRAEEVRGEFSHLTVAQEEMDTQLRGLKDYFKQQNARASREDELRTEMEVSRQRVDTVMTDMRSLHREELDKLQVAVRERDQVIRKLLSKRGKDVA